MFESVRARLTLWYVGVLALVLIAFSVAVYALHAAILYDSLDTELGATLEETSSSFIQEMKTGMNEEAAAKEVLNQYSSPRQAAAIFDGQGKMIAEDPALGDVHASLPDMSLVPPVEAELYTLPQGKPAEDRRVAIKRVEIPTTGKAYIIVITQAFDVVNRELRLFGFILSLVVLAALLLAGAGGWFLARRTLAPVVEMTERAHRISAENLDERLPLTNPNDELGRLASTFNELLARLDDSFKQQRRFMADASHELRTPLSVMRTATDVTLEQDGRNESEYREALEIIDEQTRRLTRIVEDMFALARADSYSRALRFQDFRLDELIAETARAGGVLAANKGIKVEVGKLSETHYHGDEGLLRQMLMNLLDNAIKHTPAGGTISIRLKKQPSRYTITVSDTGAGIPVEAQARIFDRFFRVDKARSRAGATEVGGGAGLGLAIARGIAEAHRGRLELQRSDEMGSIFAVWLPN
ncbi:MAG TPA: ATP-binding protein [Pyrinomonadaceae bacterium]|nr:ATP-binding protein [Pyrinomonadaceae bacterium]